MHNSDGSCCNHASNSNIGTGCSRSRLVGNLGFSGSTELSTVTTM